MEQSLEEGLKRQLECYWQELERNLIDMGVLGQGEVQLRALNQFIMTDQVPIWTKNMKRRKVFRPETEKNLQEEPDTQPEALESEASTEKKHEEEQGTQQRE